MQLHAATSGPPKSADGLILKKRTQNQAQRDRFRSEALGERSQTRRVALISRRKRARRSKISEITSVFWDGRLRVHPAPDAIRDAKTCQAAVMFENPPEETRWLPPRRVVRLTLVALPSVNRLTQHSARSLIYSSSSSVRLSIPPSLTSFFSSPSVPPSLFPLQNSHPCLFRKSIPCSFFALLFFIVSLSSLLFLIL